MNVYRFVIDKNGKLVCEWMNKLWYRHMIKYYKAVETWTINTVSCVDESQDN